MTRLSLVPSNPSSTGSRPPDPVMTLNNYLQREGKTNSLLWKETSAGPAHDPTWTVAAFIQGQEYGYGTCGKKMEARQEAAHKALRSLGLLAMTEEEEAASKKAKP